MVNKAEKYLGGDKAEEVFHYTVCNICRHLSLSSLTLYMVIKTEQNKGGFKAASTVLYCSVTF
jgi:hypothetical protein